MKLLFENWRKYLNEDEEPLAEGAAKDVWDALGRDIFNLKTGQIPKDTIEQLYGEFKKLSGSRLRRALEKLKAIFVKQHDDEQAGLNPSHDPSKIDLRLDKPANMIHDIEVAQELVDDFPDKTYEQIQDLCRGKHCRQARGTIAKYGEQEMSAVANSMGKMLGILATLAPAMEYGAEAAISEQTIKKGLSLEEKN